MPMWSLAESQGMRTACLLWVASEAKIAGFRPILLRNLRWQNPGHPRSPAGAHRQRCGAAPSCPRPIARISSPSIFPNPITTATSSDPTRPKPAPPRSAWTLSSANFALRSPPPVCPSISSWSAITAWSKSEGDWINLDQFADLSAFDTVGRSALRQNRRGSRPRLQPAQARFVAIHRLSPQGCSRRSELQPEPARRRPNCRGHGAVRHSRPRPGGR